MNPQVQAPSQQEMPFALVHGTAVTELPRDLYIPPDALEVFIEAFEGPLDLLLYLIRRQNLDILDIPIAEITRQYVEYVDLMRELRLELAGEYLVMAATLAEIKSRLLLPRPAAAQEEEADPRADLVRRLQEYERFRRAAEAIDDVSRDGRDFFVAGVDASAIEPWRPPPRVSLADLAAAFADVISRAAMYATHHVARETLSVRDRMASVLARLGREGAGHVEFTSLFTPSEGRAGVVVTLLALLELWRERAIDLVQTGPFAPIHVRRGS
ncbi:MAG: ScpA family protein [Immundisolibacterales bacterium]|nr:ScpA family protein [Immundisolibacterales bacterium]